jgi:hypothetical protein
MSVPDDYTITADSCYDTYPDAVASNCHDVDNTCYNDGVPYSCTQQVCDWDYGNPVSVCSPYTWTYQWYGCAGSRDSPLNTTRDVASADPVPGVLNAACPTELTRLSSDFDGLGTKIQDMVAVGETYVPAGLEWGWRVLSPGAPYADAADKAVKPDIRKVMVLMTDGANTKSATYPDHNGSDAAAANAITAELCTKIKADGIELFTVAFDVDNAAALEMLQTCATSDTHALTADTAEELASVFQSIGQSLVALRLTQ